MDYRNSFESLREVGLDIKEGADMVMVKPGMIYLDIISKIKKKFNVPVLAYQVSGEYSLIKNAIDKKEYTPYDYWNEKGYDDCRDLLGVPSVGTFKQRQEKKRKDEENWQKMMEYWAMQA